MITGIAAGRMLVTTKEREALFSGFRGQEGDLIPLLQRVQERKGYVSTEAIEEISRFLRISENQIFGVASFYSQFRFTPPGRHHIRICLGTACHVRGGQVLVDALQRTLEIAPGQTTEDRRFDLERVACLGCCALAPVMQVDDDIYSRMTVIRLAEILERYA
jgi:NADH-quinone oxidoreductase subunit E